ncbi:MAG: response regulator transcription factor [Anaerolineales bacterium]|nr:response regulator transcription factor [Anaerolineales bacterium]
MSTTLPKKLPLRTVVADDHRLFRQGLISLMNTRPDLVSVVGEAEDGAGVVAMCAQRCPDLVLLDILMPQVDGLQAARRIRALCPDTAIIMLTASETDEHLEQALRLGVAGYLPKSLDSSELFDLVLGMTRGEVAVTHATATRVMRNLGRNRPQDPLDQITARELEVLKLAAAGESNPQIATRLQISVNTVKAHVKSILEKLNLENRTQLAAYAMRRGLSDPV